MCDDQSLTANGPLCLNARQLASPAAAINDIAGLTAGHVRGTGCKHDGGPLWVSIPIVDDPVTSDIYPFTIWARFFQRAPKKPVISRNRPRITAYNNPGRYEYSSRYESVGRDILETYTPRIGHARHLYS